MNPSAITSATPTAVSEQDHRGSVALDQWRGLALLLVLVSHGFYFTDRVNGIGRVGVNLFFFISGVLVFRSLSRTRAETHWERSQWFWFRRFRRLYPAVITYALAMLPAVWLLQHLPNLPPDSDLISYVKALPVAFFYAANYLEPPMSLGHLWSLACEMQFYLLAPLIYLAGGRSLLRRNLVFGGLLFVLMAVGAAQPFIGKWKYHFEFAVWPMMLGFTCEYRRDWFQRIPALIVTVILWLSLAICAAALGIMLLGMAEKSLVIVTGALLLLPCLLAYLFGRPMPGQPGAVMKWLGERTYSIYLWQQPFTLCNFLPSILHPAGAVISVAVGGIWFRLFERPFLTASRRAIEKAEAPRFSSGRILFSTTVVVLVLACAFFFFWRARYQRHWSEQIWPTTSPHLAAVITTQTNFASTILLLGDSRMAQWNLQLPGARIVNAAAGGLTTAQVRRAAPKLLDEFHPAAVIVEAGINDLKFIGLRPDMAGPITALAFTNLAAIADEGAKHHCQTILLEVWPAGKPTLLRRPVWNSGIDHAVDDLNSRLRELNSPAQQIYVVDLFGLAGLTNSANLFADTLHFKPEVYQRLAPALEKTLDTLPR